MQQMWNTWHDKILWYTAWPATAKGCHSSVMTFCFLQFFCNPWSCSSHVHTFKVSQFIYFSYCFLCFSFSRLCLTSFIVFFLSFLTFSIFLLNLSVLLPVPFLPCPVHILISSPHVCCASLFPGVSGSPCHPDAIQYIYISTLRLWGLIKYYRHHLCL